MGDPVTYLRTIKMFIDALGIGHTKIKEVREIIESGDNFLYGSSQYNTYVEKLRGLIEHYQNETRVGKL